MQPQEQPPERHSGSSPFVQTAITVLALGCVLALVALALLDRFGGVR